MISKHPDVVAAKKLLEQKAETDGQAVIKRFFRKESRIILHPENDSMQDIILDQTNDIEILGIVIGCIKTF